jgi:hypothetical protein
MRYGRGWGRPSDQEQSGHPAANGDGEANDWDGPNGRH